MKQQTDYGKKLKQHLIIFFAFFVLSLISGVLAFNNPAFEKYTTIMIIFLIFNGFTILFDLVIKSTKEIINGSR
jgi:hypothetical protein